ncbi:MAG: hypothetical protein EOP22_13240 [Hyphomicrobiales bacterium]|nr:MAG: hypothetical protein EOP22_13240 [Hyphomicrobiales bacterium]
MSFREKNAWIASITTILVWGYYFFEVWRSFQMGTVDGLLTRFWVCMGFTVVLMLGLNLLATRNRIRDFGARPDEFERQIEMSATTIAHRLRGWLLLGLAVACPWLSTIIAPAFPADPAGATAIFIANLILFGLVVTELVVELIHIARFRMTA